MSIACFVVNTINNSNGGCFMKAKVIFWFVLNQVGSGNLRTFQYIRCCYGIKSSIATTLFHLKNNQNEFHTACFTLRPERFTTCYQ